MTTFSSVTQSSRRRYRSELGVLSDVLGFHVKQTVPDVAPFVFVWLERDGVGVFLNDPKAVAHDFPARCGERPAVRDHVLRRQRSDASMRASRPMGRSSCRSDTVLWHARVRH